MNSARRLKPESLKTRPANVRTPPQPLREQHRADDLDYFRARYDASHPDAPHVAAIIRQLDRGDWDADECEEDEGEE